MGVTGRGMKANKKAIKRLTKIEALLADVSERYSSGASHIRAALQDAMAAFARVKAAVSSEASSRTAKHGPVNRKKTAVKKAATKAAKTAKKPAPSKKTSKKAAAKKTAAAPIPAATEA